MITKRAYYLLKPYIPARVRLALRRLNAKRIRKSCGDVWPIHELSGDAPQGWPGWPEQKEIAFCLTHDVESKRGVERCRQLAEIEMEYGFRSSFNFIPRGECVVPPDLLRWLEDNGFEVGVHDLRHDGTLFQSLESFQSDAGAINRQLQEWNAVGFRAGFMLHKLDWLHQLNIAYDASTFDVDPFEPQPDGAQTIFPFWVPAPNPEADRFRNGLNEISVPAAVESNGSRGRDRGYVELPYTLLQDYNCFVVLQEKTIDLWKKKLRWLIAKRGMALLDTHPDYMSLSGAPKSAHEFSIDLYRDFLEHVRSTYTGRYWAALPKDIAAYCRPLRPQKTPVPRRIIMLTYSHYQSDNRVRRYAETLVRRGDEVRVYCLGSVDQVKAGTWETLNGVQILRLQSRITRESNKWTYVWRLACFFFRSFRALNPSKIKGGCDLLHIHNIPDFLVFAGLRFKLRGTPIILDIHDIVPEFFQSKFEANAGTFLTAALRKIEKWSCNFADHVIIANHIWKQTLLGRSARSEKLTALVNNVDLDLFARAARTRTDDRIILIYPGSLNYHQGMDLAIEAVGILAASYPSLELHIYGGGPTVASLKQQAAKLGLEKKVQFRGAVSLEEVPGLMANADIGIVPKRAEGFGDQAYSTKIMEFMSQGLPVVLSRTRIDSLYFNDSVAAFFESGNPRDLARAVQEIIDNPEYRQQLSERGYAYAQANSWDTMKDVYLDVVDRLTMTAIPRADERRVQEKQSSAIASEHIATT